MEITLKIMINILSQQANKIVVTQKSKEPKHGVGSNHYYQLKHGLNQNLSFVNPFKFDFKNNFSIYPSRFGF